MGQFITTEYRGPTNTKGSRIIAKTASGLFKTTAWDYALGVEENHACAAQAMVAKMNWKGSWAPCADAGGGFIWVNLQSLRSAFTSEEVAR